MNVFKIVWRDNAYHVSIPNYEGGDVVPYETARDLQKELEAERAKVAKLRNQMDYMLSFLDEMQTLASSALNETKPNEPKRIQ